MYVVFEIIDTSKVLLNIVVNKIIKERYQIN